MTSAPVAFLNKLRSRVALQRADILGREQGQAIVRVVLSTIVFFYLLAHLSPVDFSQGMPDWLIFGIVFLTFSAAVAAAALRSRQSPAYAGSRPTSQTWPR